ncbi:phage major capsid protein [Turicibacter sanguinis]|nr:phage major capsid protein [Turicibacter sanguinis]MTN84850.1 phage major capsid protein [Turicibacter sanguinis]MTN87672.1 phage major capsid protein [Turicibacter sanguinis]MTN90494.1 phage major capsid protein [Turicibacter sanguinis]MTN93416.1 phage major capsid protein [Turicibacter sanguinis]
MNKNELIEKMLQMNEMVVQEQRDFSDEEQNYYDSLEKELRQIQKQEIRQNCNVQSDLENRNRKELKGNMNNMDFSNAIKNNVKNEGLVNLTNLCVETRTGNGVTVHDSVTKVHNRPDNFLDGVFMEAVHQNLLLQLAHVIQSSSESKLLIGEEMGELKKLGEMEEIVDTDFVTNLKTILPERYGMATTVSRLLMDSASFDAGSHVQRLFARSLACTVEKIIADVLDNDEDIQVVAQAQEMTILNTLVGTLAVMPEGLRTNACIIMNPTDYSKMVTEVDSVGRNILDFSLQNSLRCTVMGVPVVISEKVQHIYVGSLFDAVAIAVNLNRFEAEQKPRNNAVAFYINVYAGGTVKTAGAVKRVVLAE